MTSFSLKIVGLLIVGLSGAGAYAQSPHNVQATCSSTVSKVKAAAESYAKACSTAMNGKTIADYQTYRRAREQAQAARMNDSGNIQVEASVVNQETAVAAFKGCNKNYKDFLEVANPEIAKAEQAKKEESSKSQPDTQKVKQCEDAIEQSKNIRSTASSKQVELNKALFDNMDQAKRSELGAQAVVDTTAGGDGEGSSWKDIAKWGTIAGVAGVGAMALLGGGGSSSKPNQYNTGTTSGGGTGAPNSGNSQITVDCNNLSAAVSSSSCDTQTVVTCNSVSQITTSSCQTFSNRYCGLDGTPNPAGIGSSYCRAASAYSFCATSGRQTCASCIQVAQWNSPACASNPSGSCSAQFSPAQLTALQGTAACASDPIYADASVFQPANPLLPAPILPSSLNPNSVKRSVASQSVGAAYGSSLLNSNSATLKEMCKANQLVNCHTL